VGRGGREVTNARLAGMAKPIAPVSTTPSVAANRMATQRGVLSGRQEVGNVMLSRRSV